MIALAGIFEAAALVDRIAKTNQAQEAPVACLLNSLLIRNPKNTLEVYGGDHFNLRNGLKMLAGALERNPVELPREALRYSVGIMELQKQLAKRPDMLELIGQRLTSIEQQAQLFGIAHDNVVSAFAALYQETLSTFKLRLQIHGEMQFLQNPRNAERIRALLLAGIRSATLWRQLGGNRWQLFFSRRKILNDAYALLRS
ncbi:MAG: high frequency lysogenization protein HflD [Pseudomonas sp.]